MDSTLPLQDNFERSKNIRAALYTIAIFILLLLAFIFLHWSEPAASPPQANEGIEVNLGNSETGLGDVAPQLPGQPSQTESVTVPPPTAQQATPTQQTITPDETETDEAAAINNTAKANPAPPTHNTDPNKAKKVETKPNTSHAPPVLPHPKALFKAGKNNGEGGNGADSYNGVRNQGIAGGIGDQGNPNGNPQSDNYHGNAASGNGGVSIRSGLKGRGFIKLPSFEDDFNEQAKVAVDITVDKNGNVTSATINNLGTTSPNGKIRGIAIRKAKELKFNTANAEDQSGTILFNFKLHD